MRNKARFAESSPISLFPFLSILACVLGTLVFLISGLAIAQALTQPDDALVKRAGRFSELSRQELQLETQRARLEQTVTQGLRLEAELADNLNRIAELRFEAGLLRTDDQPFEEEMSLLRLLHGLAAERSRLLERIEGRTAALGNPIASAVSGGSGRPGGFHPTFVEVDADGITVHDRDQPLEVRSREIPSHPGLAAVFRRVSRDPTGIVVFLIRDTGGPNYYRVEKVASACNARHGKIPLVGHGALDLARPERG